MADDERAVAVEVVVYARPGCAFCSSLRRRLRGAGLPYRAVDIWRDSAAAATVRAATGGPETVPTVTVGDMIMINPSFAQVIEAVRQFAPDLAAGADATTRFGRLRRIFSTRR